MPAIATAVLRAASWLGVDQGDVIAYLALTDGYWQVWTMSEDGTRARQITRTPEDKMRASWYPDGRRLLVNGSDGHAYRVDLASGDSAAVAISLQGFQDAVLSPDAKSISFSLSTTNSKDDHDIWIADEDGSHLRKLTSMPWLQHQPSWSPDAASIYFLSGKGDQTHDIWRVRVSDQHVEQLTANQLYHFDVDAATDGRLAYSSNRSGSYDIWVRSTGGEDTQLTHDAALDAHPSWSPDGKHLAFESSAGGVSGIWRMDASGNGRVRLTGDSVPARFPVWRAGERTP